MRERGDTHTHRHTHTDTHTQRGGGRLAREGGRQTEREQCTLYIRRRQ